jgi:hypothetical protein
MSTQTIHLYEGVGYRRQLIGHFDMRNNLLLTRNYQLSQSFRSGGGTNHAHWRRYAALLDHARDNDPQLYEWIKDDSDVE